MKRLFYFLSRLRLCLLISLLGLLCLNFANPVKANTPNQYTFKPTETFLKETTSFIKSKIQALSSNYTYYFAHLANSNEYVLFFSNEGNLQVNRRQNAVARAWQYNVQGKGVVRIYYDKDLNIKLTHYFENYDNYLQNEDFITNIYSTAIMTGFSFSNKFLSLEEAFNDGGMTNSDKGFMSGLFQGLINALLAPLNLIKSAVDSIGSMITNAVNAIGSAITGAISSMSSAITGALTFLGNLIKTVFWEFFEALKNLFIPKQSDLMELIEKFRNWFVIKFGGLGQVLVFLTQFVESLTSGVKTFVVDLPPISLFGIQIINLDYDISEITKTYKVLYDAYYMFVSLGLIFSFIGYLTTQMDTLFND